MEVITITNTKNRRNGTARIAGLLGVMAVTLTGCGGGATEFNDAQQLWEAVQDDISCASGELYVEHKEASGEVPAFGEAVCEQGDIGNQVQVIFDGLVVEDAETLNAFIENDNMKPNLIGPNWAITLRPDSSVQQEFVDQWVEEVQSDIGGEIQSTLERGE